jgi:hypothetical protein
MKKETGEENPPQKKQKQQQQQQQLFKHKKGHLPALKLNPQNTSNTPSCSI